MITFFHRYLAHNLHCFLVGQPFRAIGYEDDTAIGESHRLNDMLHYKVIAMGIDADVGILSKTPVDAEFGDPSFLSP